MDLFGVSIANMTMEEAIAALLSRLDGPEPAQIQFVNAHCANIAWRDREYRDILREADLVFADGIGMRLAGKMLRQEVRDNVNGTDMFPRLCEALSGEARGMFLFGGRPGVAEDVQRWVALRYPDVMISGCSHGYVRPPDEDDLIERINGSGARILLVALGVPRQEKWIRRNLPRLQAGVVMGVGGLFDFYSGRIPRAPVWMRRLGLEWTYRLYQEPARMWKRYILGNPLFLWRVLREAMRA